MLTSQHGSRTDGNLARFASPGSSQQPFTPRIEIDRQQFNGDPSHMMGRAELNFNVVAWTTLFVTFNFLVSNAIGQDTETKPSLEGNRAHFSEQIEKLGSEKFLEREGAMRKLLELPVSALPWVEEKLEQLKDGSDLEIRGRLARVAANLSKQKAESLLAGVFTEGAIKVPYDCVVFIEPIGGRAGATSEIGLGTSPKNFKPFVKGLPKNTNPGPIRLGIFRKNDPVPLAISSKWGHTHFAFIGSQDKGSLCAFTDTDGSLKKKGLKVIEPKGDRFLMRLDDAASSEIDDNEGDLLIEIWFQPLEADDSSD